jgi:predicted HTH transcriptional regulator
VVEVVPQAGFTGLSVGHLFLRYKYIGNIMMLRSPTTAAQIDIWRSALSETPNLEFKEAKNQYDNEKLFQYCVAIANEGGGYLVLGVSNIPPRIVTGTSAFNDPQKMEEKIFNTLGFRVDLEAVTHQDGRVLVCHIPSRPRGTAYAREGAYLMRCGESLRPMTEDQLRKIFSEGLPNWLDEYTATELTSDEINSSLDLKAYFALAGIPYPSDDKAAIDRFVLESLIDEAGNRYSLPRITALMFSKDLEAYSELARKAVRVVVYNGTDKLDTKLERTGKRGYAAGFRGMVRFIGEQLPQNEVIENAIRREVKLVPDSIIRELVANALIHQDFDLQGTSVIIEVYKDRLEITNPGAPQIPTNRFIDGCQSRNERLAMIMRKLRICEEKGSGIDRVIQSAEVLQLAAPDFRAGYQSTTVVISGPRAFEDMSRDDRVRACYQHCVLRYVRSEQMTNQTLRDRFKLPESKSTLISQIISAAVDADFIKQDIKAGGSRKFARYIPIWA